MGFTSAKGAVRSSGVRPMKPSHGVRCCERPNAEHTPLRTAQANSSSLRKACLAETLGERGEVLRPAKWC